MEEKILTAAHFFEYKNFLRTEERAPATIEKYLRDVRQFAAWINGAEVTKDAVLAWREYLLDVGMAPVTVNAKLSAINSLFQFLGWPDRRVKLLKIQRRVFRAREKELSRRDFERLVETARSLNRERLALLMETICATGIRVSELRYITAEAVRSGGTEVRMKGKIRPILLPGKLCRKLLKYAGKNKIASGEIFVTKGGAGLSRKQIWREMKSLCEKAGVEASKVFPHNLRHLFAALFYKTYKDIVKLADILGHSCIETTRIYLISTDAEHTRCLERLGLVS